jgi:hypothetical protein
MHAGGIFCDLVKAFACVNNKMLLAKLHFCGIQGVSEDRFGSYLTKSKQKIEVTSPNSTQIFFSDWDTLKHGVPEGLIPGPLLFILHTNNLTLKTKFCIKTNTIICL